MGKEEAMKGSGRAEERSAGMKENRKKYLGGDGGREQGRGKRKKRVCKIEVYYK